MRKQVIEFYCDNCDTRYERGDGLVTERFTFNGELKEVDLCKENCHQNFLLLMQRGTVIKVIGTPNKRRDDDPVPTDEDASGMETKTHYAWGNDRKGNNFICSCKQEFTSRRGLNMHITMMNRKAESK